MPALVWASSVPHLPLVKNLLTTGADPNKFYKWPSALSHAINTASIELVTLLLDHGADVDAVNGVGDRSLHVAAVLGGVEVVEVLVARGADLLAEMADGLTALRLGAQGGDWAILQFC